MANVCVITGGGSGMGLETARNIDKDVILVLTGRTVSKLENAKAQLEAEGHQVHLIACDVSVRRDVHELCLFADSLGTIKTVIHAAGLSPTMADAEKKGEKPVLTSFNVYNLTRNNQFDSTKAKEELGYSTRSYEETLHDMLEWLFEQGIIKKEE